MPTSSIARRSRMASTSSIASALSMAGLIALFCMGTAPATLTSSECGTESPRLVEQGDDYYRPLAATDGDPDSPVPTARGPASVLDSSWSPVSIRAHLTGKGYRVTCFGAGDERRTVTVHFDLDDIQRRSAPSGTEHLHAREDQHTIVSEPSSDRLTTKTISTVIELPPRQSWTLDADGKTLTTNWRFHRRGASLMTSTDTASATNSGVVLVEVDLMARPTTQGAMEIKQTTWINGYRDEEVVWQVQN